VTHEDDQPLYCTLAGLETARSQWRRFPTPGLCFSGWQPRSAWINSRRFSPRSATRLFVH